MLLKSSRISLIAGVAGCALAFPASAQVASSVLPGAFDGSYADLATQITDAETAVAGAQTTLTTATADLTAAQAEVTALNSSLTTADTALLAEYATVSSLVDQQAELAVLSAAVDDAQVAFSISNTPANLLALQEAQAAFNAANDAYVADLAAYDPAADPLTFDATAAQTALAGTAVSTAAATEIGTPAGATVANLLAAASTREAAVTAAQTTVDTATTAVETATLALAPLQRSDTILAAAAASPQENIALASGALTGDPAAAGSNFETEVVGALTDHETRITANTTAIAAETEARIAADTALGTRITAEVTARIAADTAETNARIAADTALSNRITSESAARIAADDILRDEIASSTATAIALGGAVILPDVNFTLSGNVGFYEGAQAVAVNAAARVAPNAYITGAFGGGLNKRGNVGGRVGVVFGF